MTQKKQNITVGRCSELKAKWIFHVLKKLGSTYSREQLCIPSSTHFVPKTEVIILNDITNLLYQSETVK